MQLLILEDDSDIYSGLLQQDLPSLHIWASRSVESAAEVAGDCDVWLGQPDLLVQLLTRVAPPRWIQSTWAGVDAFLAPGLPRNFLLTRTVGAFGQSMAEYALSYMLANERNHQQRINAQQNRVWDNSRPGSLADRTALVVGCGDIGSAVGQFLRQFCGRVYGIARSARHLSGFDAIHLIDDLPELVSKSDYVINLLPDNTATRGIYNQRLFNCFKQNSVFINAGRGSAVVEDELVEAVNNGRISQAVLDVCQTEPPQTDSALWNTAGIHLTGHTAAPSAPAAVVALFKANLERFTNNDALAGMVSW